MNTEIDIYNAAHAAALASLNTGDGELEQEKFRTTAFEQAGGNEKDYGIFKNFYTDRRNFLKRINGKASPSAKAAALAKPTATPAA